MKLSCVTLCEKLWFMLWQPIHSTMSVCVIVVNGLGESVFTLYKRIPDSFLSLPFTANVCSEKLTCNDVDDLVLLLALICFIMTYQAKN